MKILSRKIVALTTAAFFIFSSLVNAPSAQAWPWSRSKSVQTEDGSASATAQGSVSNQGAYGGVSGQVKSEDSEIRSDLYGGVTPSGRGATAEVQSRLSGNAGDVPFSVEGKGSATARGSLDSNYHPQINTQTASNVTASVGKTYHSEGSGSVSSGPIAQSSFTRQSQSGNASIQGSARTGSLDASGDYSATANSSGAQVTAHGNVRATLAESEIRGHYRTGSGSTAIEVTGRGEQFVGAEGTGRGHASVNRSGISGGGEVDLMAGARQRVEVGTTINLLGLVKVTTKFKGEAIEGGGVNAHVNLQASGRGIAISTGFAGAAGLGGGFATEFEVDVSGITEPIGKAIGKAAEAVGGFFKNLLGIGAKDKEAEEEPACGAKGDNVFCADERSIGPRPGPRPDPAEEWRRREEERRREREERRREEEEQKRREKEEKERKRREKEEREKEERRKKGEETWRKLPPLSKPKTGGATGRTLDPDTGEITEGVMDPDGTTVITKKDPEGNIVSEEVRKRYAKDTETKSQADFSSFDAVQRGGLTVLNAPGSSTPTATFNGGSARDMGVSTGTIHTGSTPGSHHDYSSSSSSSSSYDYEDIVV